MNNLGVDKIDYGEFFYREYYDSYVEGGFWLRKSTELNIILKKSL